ncbi:MAG: PilN domain-containing protein [Candidatus Omnitrophica bacterium]|nr:PilN domain-containing protein [Candidatus Omnitrophota bacterium]
MLKTAVYLTKQKLRIAKFNVTGDGFKKVQDLSIGFKNGALDEAKIKEVIRKEGIAKTQLLSCLFRHQAGVRFFSFPTHDYQEISRMVRYEAAELLPLKPDETTIRYLVLNKKESGYSDTLVVVTHKTEVLKLIEGFQKLGLEIDSLNLSSLAIVNSLRYLMHRDKNLILKSSFMIVYFEDEAVEIIIVKNGVLAFSRGFLQGVGKNFSQVLISEIRLSIELFFNNIKQRKLSKIIIGGFRPDLEQIADALKPSFDIPFFIEKKIDIASGMVFTQRQEINLLSDEFLSERMREKLKKKIFISSVLVIANILLVAAMFWMMLSNKESYLRKIEEKLSRLKPQAQAIQNKAQKLQMVQTQLISQLLILDAITDLINVASATSTLNMLSINEQGVLVVRGQAKSLGEVLDFVGSIENSSYFKNSHLNFSSRRKIKDEELIDFEIQANLDKAQGR